MASTLAAVADSAVAHLVAASPQGPFTFLDMALPLWHTNPQVVRALDGTFLLFAIGQCVNRSAWIECNCSAQPACPPGPANPNLAGIIDVHTSPSPYGPWTPLAINGSTIVMHGTNPTPYMLPNGTLLVGVNSEGTHVAQVEDWRVGPYKASPVGTLPNEPQTWWEDVSVGGPPCRGPTSLPFSPSHTLHTHTLSHRRPAALSLLLPGPLAAAGAPVQ